MIKYLNRGVIFLAALLVSSCVATKRYVEFEVLQPSPVTYPEYVKNIAVLNRAPLSIHSFAKVNQYGIEDNSALWIIDTIICNNIFKGFNEGKAVNELSQYNYLEPLSYRKRDTIRRSVSLTELAHKSFFDSYDIDALISMEYYQVRLDMSKEYYDFDSGDRNVEYRCIFELSWRIYSKDSAVAIDEYTQLDTLYYLNHSGMKASELMTPIDIIKDCAAEFGFRYGIRLVPLWNEINRLVFSGRDESLVIASKATDKGDWESARRIWESMINSEDLKLAAKSLHNLAVSYEMEDELVQALYYSEEAAKLWENQEIVSYHEDLKVRVKNKEELLKQVR